MDIIHWISAANCEPRLFKEYHLRSHKFCVTKSRNAIVPLTSTDAFSSFASIGQMFCLHHSPFGWHLSVHTRRLRVLETNFLGDPWYQIDRMAVYRSCL